MPNLNGSSGWSLQLVGLERGTLHGRLISASGSVEAPEIEVCVDGTAVGHADVATDGEDFVVSASLPAEALREGMTSVVLRMRSDQTVLGSYPMRAGRALDGDIVADLATLKAELQALKDAFLMDAHIPKLRAVERDLIIAEAVDASLAARAVDHSKDRQGDA